MKAKIRNLLSRIIPVISLYPMVLTTALIAGVCAFILAYYDSSDHFPIVRLLFSSLLGIPLFFAAKMRAQKSGNELLLTLVSLVLVGLFYFSLPSSEEDFSDRYIYWIFPVFFLSHLVVALLPYLSKKRNESKFWEYNKNLFIQIVQTAVFSLVLVGGVVLAILSIDKLFLIDLKTNLYPATFFFLIIFFNTFIFLLFSGEGISYLEKEREYPEILKFFTQFVLIPLLLIYSIILYLYAIKILFSWQLPEGWVSYLILSYAVVGTVAQMLVDPLKGQDKKSWVRYFSSIFYYSLIPLLVLLFVAIFTRILEYGFTEPRYYVLALAIWLVVITGGKMLKKNQGIRFIPFSLLIIGLIALFMPFINAFSVAKQSQKQELSILLKENKLLKDGKIDFSANLEQSKVDEIADKFMFLYERKERDYLFTFLTPKEEKKISEIEKKNPGSLRYFDIRNLFSNVKMASVRGNNIELRRQNLAIHTGGYRYIFSLESGAPVTLVLPGDSLKVEQTFNQSLKSFTITNSKGDTHDFMPLIKKKLSTTPKAEIPTIADLLEEEFTLGGKRMKIIYTSISKGPSEKDMYYVQPFILLVE